MNRLVFIQKPDEEILINFYTLITVNMTEINIMIQVTREVISYLFSSFDPHLIRSWPNEWIKRMKFIFPGFFFFYGFSYLHNQSFLNEDVILPSCIILCVKDMRLHRMTSAKRFKKGTSVDRETIPSCFRRLFNNHFTYSIPSWLRYIPRLASGCPGQW